MERWLVRYSKFLSMVLRHKPQKIGLNLNAHGWANVEQLIQLSNEFGVKITPDILQQVVEQNDKQRFEFNEDETQIRARQGHSIPVDLELEPQMPPEVLYHGTASRSIASIQKNGLIPIRRNHVHLSLDFQTAQIVGKRHGQPVVLKIHAGDMYRAGYLFYLSANGVWLTDQVPAEFIEIY